MIKINGTEISELKYKGVDIEKVICNGVVVFEKIQDNAQVTFKTSQTGGKNIYIQTTDDTPVKMYQGDTEVAILQSETYTNVQMETGKEYILKNCENLQYLDCNSNQLTDLNVQGLTSLKSLDCQSNQLTELNVQGLTNLQYLCCNSNQLTENGCITLFNSLPQTTNGKVFLYIDGDNNFKDYSTGEIATAFQNVKNRGWKFYKNNISDSNLL